MGTKKIRLMPTPEPEPGTATILRAKPPGTAVVKGEGDVDYVCGRCETVLMENIVEKQVTGCFLFCNNCKSYSYSGD
ncbi:MAG TPA: hypothetical protein VGB63_18495 [Pedobacter sp.]|jgi:hypothetical protein